MAEEMEEILDAEASRRSIGSFQASMATSELDLISLALGGKGSGTIFSLEKPLESSRRADRQRFMESSRWSNRLFPSYPEYEGYWSYPGYMPYDMDKRKRLFPLYPGYEGKWPQALERLDDQRHSTCKWS